MSDATVPQPGTSPATATPAKTPDAAGRAARFARYAFWVMFFINFINYFDRFIFNGLNPYIEKTLRLNDFEIGLAVSGFLLVYTIVAIPLGFLADRVARRAVVALGVALWSVASFATGLAGNLASLLGIRTILGIGEGSYYPAGTPLLAAFYPPRRRPQILSRWTVGALAGAAVGFLVAGFFTKGDAWRNAFFFSGIPGLILAVLIWRVPNQTRHEDDPPTEHLEREGRTSFGQFRAYLRIPTLRTVIGTQAMGFFASTGAQVFFANYLNATYTASNPAFSHPGLDTAYVPILAGAVVLIGGVGGTLYGSPFAHWLSKRHSGARVLAGGLGYLFAAPAVIVAVGSQYVLDAIPAYTGASETVRLIISLSIFSVSGALAAAFLNFYQGPTTAAVLDVVPANERAGAGGTVLALSHLLGDVYAAALIGAVASLLNHALGGEQIGLALLLTCPLALVISGVIGIRGSRHYAADVAALGSNADAMLGTRALEAEAARG